MSDGILVELTKRDLSTSLPLLPVKLTVRDYSWHVWGGPLMANIDVEAETPLLLWEIVEWLRYGVKLRSKATARAHWWGFIDAIQLSDGVVNFGIELDSMNNRVMANYTYQADGQTQTSSMSTTWVQDDDSVSTYGAKELQVQSNNCSTEFAESDRDKALNAFRFPQPTINMSGGSGNQKLSGSLRLSGWWKTLDWMYYINASTAYQTVATQINNIYTQCGQFFTGIDVQAIVGLLSSEYRDGSRMGRSEMEDLLKAGASGSGWLLANIDENRLLTVSDEPARDSGYFFIANDGSLTNKFNTPILPEECPVGKWLYTRSGVPETADLGAVERPFPAFIVEATYDAKTASYRPVTRGRPSPYELMGTITK